MRTFWSDATDQGRARAPVSRLRRRKLLLSYAPDWLITIALAIIFFSMDKVDGYKRVFSVNDTSLRHPYAEHERVPNIALYFICFAAPVLLQPLINVFTAYLDQLIQLPLDVSTLPSFLIRLILKNILPVILGLALTGSITQFTKITVGRPRPDVIDRCQPIPGTDDPVYGLSTAAICQQTDAGILRDGFRSFPSGHSSMSFAGLGFLSFYLAGKLHLFDERGHAGKAWLALTPFCAAALVAISRTMDYRHHWQDVLVGSILGTVLSYFSYRQYYPSLSSEMSHRPYSPRIPREDDERLPMHHGRTESTTAMAYRPSASPQRRPRQDCNEGTAVDGTVPRPGPGDLEEVWREGSDDEHHQQHQQPYRLDAPKETIR
ncbi:hypothetical protein HGRIS_013200 [Hohenbuehelia grisea]|uniref:Phosphatidic acid phosphatase type 2/haloperoxidase domain-containing protein n=1 Tax=Hohenbuehelia grisea TaxID=104357 RepID=A0ABR3IUN2_9AGAR